VIGLSKILQTCKAGRGKSVKPLQSRALLSCKTLKQSPPQRSGYGVRVRLHGWGIVAGLGLEPRQPSGEGRFKFAWFFGVQPMPCVRN
jgi:hypothetical protein